ncbi:hypothetical protein E2C06_12260 [Dankookia rubra]|uniref:Uncharacterized protein n=1 Tax=Dankookia rubra TaxID=1442381 RepID=A0A4R5QHE2_9PROT|nr:hypothetical protein [Dankookia rubra]TDH62373.1 hypothetical protein E2C06_12260 [Dankookia rubra]
MENRQAVVRRQITSPKLTAWLRSKALTALIVLIAGSLILLWSTGATFTAEEASVQSSHRTPSTDFAARIEAAIR